MTQARACVVIVGAGDHGRVVLELLRALRMEPAGFVEPRSSADRDGQAIDGLAVLGDLGAPAAWHAPGMAFVAALGDNRARADAFQRCLDLGLRPAEAIHPSATLLAGAVIEPGAVVCAGAIVGVAARVAANAIVNTGATVDHDGRIGQHAHLGPGAHLAGHVTLGDGALVGIGGAVLEGLTIGAWAVVAGGAIVIADVPQDGRVAGVPARAMMTTDPGKERP